MRGLEANSPAAVSQWGSGAEPPGAVAILLFFFSKKYAYLGIFWPKFLLKNSFYKCLNKVC